MGSDEQLIGRADLLRAQVDGHPENRAEVVPQLVEMLGQSERPDVLVAIAAAVNAAWTDEASLALLPFIDHPDDRVRLAVTQAMPGGVEHDHNKRRIAHALIALAADPSSDVRHWATFGLGTLGVDGPAVRDALRARLSDSNIDTRLEAIVGLAERRDPSVLSVIRAGLQAESVDRLIVDAARAFADPSLVAPLQEVAKRWREDPSIVERAIDACASEPQER